MLRLKQTLAGYAGESEKSAVVRSQRFSNSFRGFRVPMLVGGAVAAVLVIGPHAQRAERSALSGHP